jgi:antitoxin VapB
MTRSTSKKDKNRKKRPASTSGHAEAKIFMTGRSQAVRLPKEFRFTGASVHINRLGDSVVLTPKSADRWSAAFAALDEFPRDFMLDRGTVDQQERPGLTELFDSTGEENQG